MYIESKKTQLGESDGPKVRLTNISVTHIIYNYINISFKNNE